MSEELGLTLWRKNMQTLEHSAEEGICTYFVCVMTNKKKQRLSVNGITV